MRVEEEALVLAYVDLADDIGQAAVLRGGNRLLVGCLETLLSLVGDAIHRSLSVSLRGDGALEEAHNCIRNSCLAHLTLLLF